MLNMVRAAKAKEEGRDPKAHLPAPIPEQPAISKPVGFGVLLVTLIHMQL